MPGAQQSGAVCTDKQLQAALGKIQQQRKEAHGREMGDAKEMPQLAAQQGSTINLADFGF
ncbi:MAG TPA: hypothetical protein VMF91_25395 [Bryobacteraceae bacterium]|jgi:hypothetical protein|nr:hypothetical protein [Bryobacteraceae bacterium]